MYSQIRKASEKRRLGTDFPARDEPQFAWRALGLAHTLPFCRASWVFSTVDNSGSPRVADLSGMEHDLYENGSLSYLYYPNTIIPCGASDEGNYWEETALTSWSSISGVENCIQQNGLTILVWVNFMNDASARECIAGKVAGSPNRHYCLRRTAGGGAHFYVSSDGINWDGTVTSPAAEIADKEEWHFLAGRFDPNADTDEEMYLRIDSETFLDSGPASIQAGSTKFTVASTAAPIQPCDAWYSQLSLHVGALSDSLIKMFYHQTAPMFNLRPSD